MRVEGGEGGGGGRVTFARGEVFVELEKEAEEENGDGWGEEAYRKDLRCVHCTRYRYYKNDKYSLKGILQYVV